MRNEDIKKAQELAQTGFTFEEIALGFGVSVGEVMCFLFDGVGDAVGANVQEIACTVHHDCTVVHFGVGAQSAKLHLTSPCVYKTR